MAFDGIWRLTDPPMSGPQVSQIQNKALSNFASYAVPLGVKVNGVYDQPTRAFVAEYQTRKMNSGYRPLLPANPAAESGDCDWATKVALGIIGGSVIHPPDAVPPYVAYSCPGTWGIWNDGPHWWAVDRLDGRRFWKQGVQWNTGAFLQPDPRHSYVDAVGEGVGELLRLALPDPRPKVMFGWSMGADVITRALYAWPADRRDEIRYVVKFGDPGHLPGVQGSVNGGIARVFTPDWVAPRTRSYQIDGDMYGDAPGLLPFFYEILTRMEASGEFLFYLFGLLTGIPVGQLLDPRQIGPQPTAPPNLLGQQLLGIGGAQIPGFGALSGLLGLITGGPLTQTGGPISMAAMLLNLPAIIRSLLALMRFLITNAHMRYGGTGAALIFNGTDAVIDSANTVNALRM